MQPNNIFAAETWLFFLWNQSRLENAHGRNKSTARHNVMMIALKNSHYEREGSSQLGLQPSSNLIKTKGTNISRKKYNLKNQKVFEMDGG